MTRDGSIPKKIVIPAERSESRDPTSRLHRGSANTLSLFASALLTQRLAGMTSGGEKLASIRPVQRVLDKEYFWARLLNVRRCLAIQKMFDSEKP